MALNTSEMLIEGREVSVEGSWIRVARLSDEWYVDVKDPESLVSGLVRAGLKADLFTFWQRLAEDATTYRYFRDWDSIAALPVTTYENWLKHQINFKVRNKITKARKNGVVTKPARFDDEFIRGMVAIFNENPIRQGKPFWHYGKDFETIKREFSRYLFREQLFGAYVEGELAGFIFLADAGRFVNLGQIISMIRHRDKGVNNALIAKAVEVCAEKGMPYLTYAVWPRGPLKDFKRHNGFERVDLPRYYIPLTKKGDLALKLGLHRKMIDRLPDPAYLFLRDVRARFYGWRYRDSLGAN